MTFTEEDKRYFLEFHNLSGELGEEKWKAKIEMHSRQPRTHMVLGDLQPYRSMATGEMIHGRKQHREMLIANNCIEIGNENQPVKPRTPPPGLKDELIRAVNEKLRS